MNRFEMTGHDRYLMEKAREALASVDVSDERAMARSLGRLEVVVQQLLEMLGEGER